MNLNFINMNKFIILKSQIKNYSITVPKCYKQENFSLHPAANFSGLS